MTEQQMYDFDEWFLRQWYEANGGVLFKKIVDSGFFASKEEAQTYLNELVLEGLLRQEHGVMAISYFYEDNKMALRRADKRILSGQWQLEKDNVYKSAEEKKESRSPNLRGFILFLLLKRKTTLCMNDARLYYTDHKLTRRREGVFLRAVGNLLEKKFLVEDNGQIMLTKKGIERILELVKQPDWFWKYNVLMANR